MRENKRIIKFRAWNKDKKCFFKWDLTMGFRGTDKIWGNVQQFTGLTDKDGRERYEHDIYEVRVNGTKTHVEYVICVVRWSDDSAGFGFKKIDSDSEIPEWMGMLDPNIISIKYLGNIHQHPELLK